MRRLAPLVLPLLVALLACSDDDGGGATPTAPVTTGAATTGPATTGPASSAPGTTQPGCTTEGDTSRKQSADPLVLSSLVGRAMRFARFDECTERFVVELQGDGELPGWWAEYEASPSGPSGLPVELEGDAYLVLHAGSWMTTMDGAGYQGPMEVDAQGFTAIQEVELVENFEGMFAWAIGLDQQRPFVVSTLPDPPRIVVDIYTG